jgi:4-amino-4-deoxy-L-arabinose transferase-like glycosyltransferase
MARRLRRIGEHGLPLAAVACLAWLVAALAVRALPGLFESRGWAIGMCLAAVLVSDPLVRLAGAVLGIPRPERAAPAGWFAACVLACHALALLFWPSIYGSDEAVARNGQAWLVVAAIAPVFVARFWAERT